MRTMIAFRGQVLFFGTDGVSGGELWKSDGTAAGTVLVKDIEPGSGGLNPFNFRYFGGGVVYFTASNTVYGREVWRTDGTTAGTRIVADSIPGNGIDAATNDLGGSIFQIRDRLLLNALHPVYGSELFSVPLGASVQQVGFDDRSGLGGKADGLPWHTGSGCAASGFAPDLDATPPVLGGAYSVQLSQADPTAPAALVFGAIGGRTQVPFAPAGCVMWIDLGGPLFTVGLATNASGAAATPPSPVPAAPALIGAAMGCVSAVVGPSGVAPLSIAWSNTIWLTAGL